MTSKSANEIAVRRLSLHDHETELAIAGSGQQTAILLHAIGLDWRMWSDLLACFPPGIRLVAYDLRGHGIAATTPPTTIEQHVDDACALLDHLEVERAHVFGLSYGGAVAQMIAVMRPSRVASLGLLATFSRAPRELLLARAAAAERNGLDPDIDVTLTRWFSPAELDAQTAGVRYARERLRADRVENWAAGWRALADFDVAGLLRGVHVPATVIAGEHDTGTPPLMLRAIADELPRSRFHLLSGCYHMLSLEQPEALAALLANGLEGVRS